MEGNGHEEIYHVLAMLEWLNKQYRDINDFTVLQKVRREESQLVLSINLQHFKEKYETFGEGCVS